MQAARHIHLLEHVGSGGLETRLESLRRLDPDVDHVIASGPASSDALGRFWGGQRVMLPYDLGLKTTIGEFVAIQAAIARAAGETLSAVVQTHAPMAAIAAASALGESDAVHVHTIHGPLWFTWSHKALSAYAHVVAHAVDHLVVVSPETRDIAAAFGLRREPIELSNVSALIRPSQGREPRDNNDVVRAAFAARLDADKIAGLLDLVAAVAPLTDQLEVDVFGDGGMASAVEDAAREVGNVNLAGLDMAFGERVADYDVVIGQGRVILEALAAGVPAALCDSRLIDFVTAHNLERVLYANATARRLPRDARLDAARLLDPPPPPRLPEPRDVRAIHKAIAVQGPQSVREARKAFQRRIGATTRAFSVIYSFAYDAIGYAFGAGRPWSP